MMKNVLLIVFLLFTITLYAQKAKTLGSKHQVVWDVAIHPDYTNLASTSGHDILIWNLNANDLSGKYKRGHTDDVTALAYSIDGKKLISGGIDGKVILWNTSTKEPDKILMTEEGVITAVKFSKNGKLAAAASSSDKIFVWEVADGKLLYTLTAHTDDVTGLDFSIDHNILASAGADHAVILWDLLTGALSNIFVEHSSWVRDISFSNKGNALSSVGDDGQLIIWNLENNKYIKPIEKSKFSGDWLLSVLYNEQGNAIALGSRKGKVIVKTEFGSYLYKTNAPVNKVIFLRDQNKLMVAAATYGKGILIISATDMKFSD